MWEFGVIFLIVGALALLVLPRIMRSGPRGEVHPGTLLVTGVSPRPDATGEQYVTVSGVISGPTLHEHAVYRQMAVDTANWPTMGALFPVVYSAKNPDNWTFASPTN